MYVHEDLIFLLSDATGLGNTRSSDHFQTKVHVNARFGLPHSKLSLLSLFKSAFGLSV